MDGVGARLLWPLRQSGDCGVSLGMRGSVLRCAAPGGITMSGVVSTGLALAIAGGGRRMRERVAPGGRVRLGGGDGSERDERSRGSSFGHPIWLAGTLGSVLVRRVTDSLEIFLVADSVGPPEHQTRHVCVRFCSMALEEGVKATG